MFLSGRRGGSSTSEASRDGVDGAMERRVSGGDVGVGWFECLDGGLGWASVVMGVVWGRLWSERGGGGIERNDHLGG